MPLLFLAALFLASLASLNATALVTEKLTVDSVTREALVAYPASPKDQPAPVVFVFHGHGGNARNVARSFDLHTLWPEAIVVYPQGLPTPGRLTDPEGKKNGWQGRKGDVGDRDLKFFDAMLAQLPQRHAIDAKRIYSTGHSNGGGFTYLLWAERPDVFAALAPSSAIIGRKPAPLSPRPVLHIAGEKDPLVKFSWQKATIEKLVKDQQCGAAETWLDTPAKIHPSKIDAPVLTLIHPGDHEFLSSAPAIIVKFFQSDAKP